MSTIDDHSSPGGFDTLARLLRNPAKKPAVGEYCELCTVRIGPEHSHLVDVKERRLLCSCRPCWLLFTPRGAAQGRYKCVPARYVALGDPALSDMQWEALQIPINLAFFFFNSGEQKMVAFYPGPAGATECLLPLGAWEEIAAVHPALATMEPDVEALLMYRPRTGGERAFLVPIDACYELVGLLRSTWKGFDGGEEAHAKLDGFFERLRLQADGVQTARSS